MAKAANTISNCVEKTTTNETRIGLECEREPDGDGVMEDGPSHEDSNDAHSFGVGARRPSCDIPLGG